MEVTIEITQFCPCQCVYCSTNATPEGKPLNKETIFGFLKSLEDPIDRINISGGEPVSHPDFYEILTYCNTISPIVCVYTNAFQRIMFNPDIRPEVEVEANVCIVPGKDVYIPKKAHKIHILKLVPKGRAKDMEETLIPISCSGNFGRRICESCNNILLQSDGKIVKSPCEKEYGCNGSSN